MTNKGYDVVLLSDANTQAWHVTPLGPHCLATVLRNNGYTVKIVDYLQNWFDDYDSLNRLIDLIIDENTSLLGFSGTLFAEGFSEYKDIKTYQDYKRSTQFTTWALSDKSTFDVPSFLSNLRIRFPKLKIAYGGHRDNHKFPELIDHVDFIVKGHAENMILDLMNHIKTGSSIKYMLTGSRAKIIDYDYEASGFNFKDTPILFDKSDHIPDGSVLPIETSRGCMFKCDFCEYPMIGRKKGDTNYHKSVDTLAFEFKRNYEQFKVTNYFFIDNIFNESTDKIKDVLRARDISEVDIKFYSYLRYEILNKYPEQIQLLKELGLISTMIGIESLHGPSAKSVGKGTDPKKVKDILYRLKDSWGETVTVMGSFIVGLPHDTVENLIWTDWLKEKSCPLDSISMEALVIDNTYSNVSPIAKDPTKYGYKIVQGNIHWKNEHWNSIKARRWVNAFMEEIWNSGKLGVGGFTTLGLMNMGIPYDQIKTLSLKNIDYKKCVTIRNNKWKDYKNNLFLYESQK